MRYIALMMSTPRTIHTYVQHLTYDSQTHLGFHGVCPSCLRLALEDESLSVNFLDLDMYMGENTTMTGAPASLLTPQGERERIRNHA